MEQRRQRLLTSHGYRRGHDVNTLHVSISWSTTVEQTIVLFTMKSRSIPPEILNIQWFGGGCNTFGIHHIPLHLQCSDAVAADTRKSSSNAASDRTRAILPPRYPKDNLPCRPADAGVNGPDNIATVFQSQYNCNRSTRFSGSCLRGGPER